MTEAEILHHGRWMLTEAAASSGWGPDLEWLASDRDGRIGVFTTAGLGPIPREVVNDPEGMAAAIVSLEEITGARFDPKWGILDPTDFGAYGYDYCREDGSIGQYVAENPYWRLVTPATPALVRLLAPKARTYFSNIRLGRICFGETRTIVMEKEFSEVYRPTAWDQYSDPAKLRPSPPRPLSLDQATDPSD